MSGSSEYIVFVLQQFFHVEHLQIETKNWVPIKWAEPTSSLAVNPLGTSCAGQPSCVINLQQIRKSGSLIWTHFGRWFPCWWKTQRSNFFDFCCWVVTSFCGFHLNPQWQTARPVATGITKIGLGEINKIALVFGHIWKPTVARHCSKWEIWWSSRWSG